MNGPLVGDSPPNHEDEELRRRGPTGLQRQRIVKPVRRPAKRDPLSKKMGAGCKRGTDAALQTDPARDVEIFPRCGPSASLYDPSGAWKVGRSSNPSRVGGCGRSMSRAFATITTKDAAKSGKEVGRYGFSDPSTETPCSFTSSVRRSSFTPSNLVK